MVKAVYLNIRLVLLLAVVSSLVTASVRPYVFDTILERGTLNVATMNGPYTYFETREGQSGFEWELAQSFAEHHQLQINIIEIETIKEGINHLKEGTADILAAGLVANYDLYSDVSFGPAYDHLINHVVYRRGKQKPKHMDMVKEGRLMVASGSTEATLLRSIQDGDPSLSWRESDKVDASDLLQMVQDGRLDYTVVNSRDFALLQDYFPKTRIAFDIGHQESIAWAFKQSIDKTLIDNASQFMLQETTANYIAELSERYFGHLNQVNYVDARHFAYQAYKTLPKYRPTFKTFANKFGLDWRLLAAVGYQESHWKPLAKSFTGVRGLMMLTQTTAAEMGIEDRLDPVQSIKGGAQYLAKLLKRLPKSVEGPDRMWFALAAYNVGYGHLMDARFLTEQLGGNPNLWLDVKEALPLLRQKRFYSKTRHGYARGDEPVKYVQNIRRYQDMLVWQEEQLLASADDISDIPVTVIPPLL